ERRPGFRPDVLEHRGVADRAVAGQVDQPVTVRPEHVAELLVGEPRRVRHVLRALDDYLVPADRREPLEEGTPTRCYGWTWLTRAARDGLHRRELVRDHPQPPAGAVARRAGRA